MGRSRSSVCLTVIMVTAVGMACARAQEDVKAIYATLSDDAKKIVTESNRSLGEDASAPCNAGRAKVTTEVRQATTRLGDGGQLSGVPGFFQIEAENYYSRICGRRMRR